MRGRDNNFKREIATEAKGDSREAAADGEMLTVKNRKAAQALTHKKKYEQASFAAEN